MKVPVPSPSALASLGLSLSRVHAGEGVADGTDARVRAKAIISSFQTIPPRFRSTQKDLLAWLVAAHVRAGGADRKTMEALFARYSASADQIASRGHELADFSQSVAGEMRLFGHRGSDLGQKTAFFEERVNAIFERFYPQHSTSPRAIVHVTCTGYTSPSGAQSLVSSRGWGRDTEVYHAYHMGCYAAHPAIRIAMSLSQSDRTVDVVHTELCSLHLDPSDHDPSQLIIQSLFADGFIQYQVSRQLTAYSGQTVGFEILAARDEIIPDSANAMGWTTGPLAFSMTLSREVPTLLASNLSRFAASLFEMANLNWEAEKPTAVFAIHPGGPRIIDLCERMLALDPPQVRWSRRILRDHGNMSSATLPHIWQKILEDATIPAGTLVVSLGAGPGLTLSGILFRKTCR